MQRPTSHFSQCGEQSSGRGDQNGCGLGSVYWQIKFTTLRRKLRAHVEYSDYKQTLENRSSKRRPEGQHQCGLYIRGCQVQKEVTKRGLRQHVAHQPSQWTGSPRPY